MAKDPLGLAGKTTDLETRKRTRGRGYGTTIFFPEDELEPATAIEKRAAVEVIFAAASAERRRKKLDYIE